MVLDMIYLYPPKQNHLSVKKVLMKMKRPLNRMIQKYIEDLIAENLVSDKIKQGDKLLIDYKSEDDHLTLLINKKKLLRKF